MPIPQTFVNLGCHGCHGDGSPDRVSKEPSPWFRIASEITAGIDLFMEEAAIIYNYVTQNIVYDFDLAENVQSGYLPVVDEILEKGKGICFDYAAVMTAMLRSQGIPTKLVIGYTGEIYHAWIKVYHPDAGWLDDFIYFDGAEWSLVDPTYGASGRSSEVSRYIGDGKNYKEQFFY